MARGQWKKSDEQMAAEAYSVLIQKNRPSRTYSKSQLLKYLARNGIYQDFLKLCAEHDESPDLASFRKGLLLVVKAIGASKIAAQTGVSRVTLYRMLSPGGNPRLTSLVTLFRTLRIRLFVVDEGFAHRGEPLTRPKEQKSVEANWKYTPKGRRQ